MTFDLGATFAAMRIRNYLLYAIGQLISIGGLWMQTVAQSFLVLDLTGSGTALGYSVAARFGPIFVLGPWGGTVTDRTDRRRLLYLTQTASAALAVAFGVLVQTDAIRMWIVYTLAVALGFVNVFDSPARQSFIPELVPTSALQNAVILNSATVNLGRVVGGAFGGLAIAWTGLAIGFYLNAASFVVVVISLLMMRSDQIARPTPRQRKKGQVIAGLRYVRTTPEVLVPLLMTSVIGMLAWEFQISLPLIAERTFDGNASTFGTMLTFMGIGAVVGGLVAASRANSPARSLSISAIGWGVAITAAALAPSLWTEYAILLFVGYGSLTFNALNKTVIQLAAVPHMRGRVMALWALVWQGSTPIGGPIVGWVGEHLGARWSLLVGGLPTIAVGILAYPALNSIDARRLSDQQAVPAVAEDVVDDK
jgi:MFS family permease